jgi:hypothetical protein
LKLFHKGIDVYFARIVAYTDPMIKILQKVYTEANTTANKIKEFQSIPVGGDANLFVKLVLESTRSSVVSYQA